MLWASFTKCKDLYCSASMVSIVSCGMPSKIWPWSRLTLREAIALSAVDMVLSRKMAILKPSLSMLTVTVLQLLLRMRRSSRSHNQQNRIYFLVFMGARSWLQSAWLEAQSYLQVVKIQPSRSCRYITKVIYKCSKLSVNMRPPFALLLNVRYLKR